MELLDPNGTVLFTTSKIGDDVNLPNSKPIVAFSPSGNCSGKSKFGGPKWNMSYKSGNAKDVY